MQRDPFLKVVGLILLTIYTAACHSPTSKEAEQSYTQGKYEEALLRYQALLVDHPDSDVINYHVGIAYYKRGNFEKAVGHFTKALATDDPVIETWAVYNIGNSKYRQGERYETEDAGRAAELYQEAIEYYKRAIELNGKDEDQKFNHDFVEKKWKELVSRLKEHSVEAKKGMTTRTHAKGEEKPELDSRRQEEAPQKRRETLTEEERKGLQKKGDKIEMSKEEAEKLLEKHFLEEETRVEPSDRIRSQKDPDLKKDW